MIRNIIFDFGAVLVDWNPHYLYDKYFGDVDKAQWFIDNVCTPSWNERSDAGVPFSQLISEKIAEFPEYEEAIKIYWERWEEMLSGMIPGMYDLVVELKNRGFHLYGLSNWSYETFIRIESDIPTFSLLEGKIISGKEKMIKPEPQIYQLLLERYNLKATECLFIDDNSNNVKAAEVLGIKAIRFIGIDDLKQKLETIL